MVKHRGFSREKFINAVGDDLLSDYLSGKNIDVSSGLPLNYEHVQELLGKLDENDEKLIDEELHCINDVAERGQEYMEIAKGEFGIETPDNEPRERTAMRLFLNENPEVFRTAYDYYSWRTIGADLSHHQFPDGQANFSQHNQAEFTHRIEKHFYDQAKGQYCKIRHRVDGHNHIVFVARGDFVKTQQVWEKGRVENEYFRPAKEDILVFNDKNHVLSLKIRSRSGDDKTEYIKAFGNHILGKDKIEDEVFTRSFVSLAPIQNGSFSYEGNEHIKSVKLVHVDMRIRERGFLRLRASSPSLVGTLERMLNVSLKEGELISVRLSFSLEQNGKRQKPVTVELRPPERTSLTKKRDMTIIEDYLRQNEVLLV